MKYITINTAAEFVCLLAAMLFLYRGKGSPWRWFIPYLFFTCLFEVAGLYMHHVLRLPNFAVYNIAVLMECGFISSFFYYLFKAYHYKIKWLIAWLSVFLLCYFTELFLNGFGAFVAVTVIIMSVVFVLAGLWYYYLKLKEEAFEPLLLSPKFWWVSGTLFFYFGSTSCNLFFDYLVAHDNGGFSYNVRYVIFNIINIGLYSFWTIAFICRYNQRKLYSL